MSGIFASGSDAVKIWSLSQGGLSQIPSTNASPVADLIWLPGGHHLVHCDAESGSVSCAKFSSGSGLGKSRPFTALPSGATALAALRSSSHFLAAGTDSVVRLLTVADGVAERTFMGHTSPVGSISCSCSDSCVAVSQERAQIILHKLAGSASISRFSLQGCGSIQRLRFSNHQESLIAAACDNAKTIVWDVVANEAHASFSSHKTGSIVTDVSFSPRNPLLMVTAGSDRQLIFHDVPKKMLIKSFQCEASLTSAAILHDGFTVVAGTQSGNLLVYDLRAGDSVVERLAGAHSSPIAVVAGRPMSTSSGSSGSRRSKSGSTTSSTSHSRAKLSSASSDRHHSTSTKLASEASPALPSLSESRPGSSKQTPDLPASKPQHQSISHSVASQSPLGLSGVSSGLSSIHSKTATGPSSTARSSVPLSSSSVPASAASAAVTGLIAGKVPSAVPNLGDSDIFSPLKAASTSATSSLQHRLASSPQLPSAMTSSTQHYRHAQAQPPRQSPLVSASLDQDSKWSATTLRSLQQAEGMETSSSRSVRPVTNTSAVSTSLSGLAMRPSPLSSVSATPALQQQPVSVPSLPASYSHQSAMSSPGQSLLSRDAIDGSEADSPALPSTQTFSPPRLLEKRQILGAASGGSSGPSQRMHNAVSTSLAMSSQTQHDGPSVQSLASAMERLGSPGKPAHTSQSHPAATSANDLLPATASQQLTSSTAPSTSTSVQPLPFHTAVLQRMVETAVDELRLAMHQHIRNVHVNLIRQIGDQTTELLAAQAQQYEVTEALLAEVQFLRDEVQRLQGRY